MSERTTMQALSSALRFAASRSAISSAEELAIMEAWNNTRTPAPTSADAMGKSSAATAALIASRDAIDRDDFIGAISIIQQYGDQRDAAGFRRGVEAAVNVAKDRARRANQAAELAPEHQEEFWAEHGAAEGIARRILALLETQEANNG